jgi:hypothetical protein
VYNWTRRIFNDQLTHLFTDCLHFKELTIDRIKMRQGEWTPLVGSRATIDSNLYNYYLPSGTFCIWVLTHKVITFAEVRTRR